MAVPVPDLLQMTHPGYPLVERDMHISQQNVPIYIDFCRCVLLRFEHYGEMTIIPPDLFKHLTKAFHTVFEDDEPATFIPAYNILPRFLEEFDYVIDSMITAFPKETKIRSFYRNMASQLRQCFEYHIQGGKL